MLDSMRTQATFLPEFASHLQRVISLHGEALAFLQAIALGILCVVDA